MVINNNEFEKFGGVVLADDIFNSKVDTFCLVSGGNKYGYFGFRLD